MCLKQAAASILTSRYPQPRSDQMLALLHVCLGNLVLSASTLLLRYEVLPRKEQEIDEGQCNQEDEESVQHYEPCMMVGGIMGASDGKVALILRMMNDGRKAWLDSIDRPINDRVDVAGRIVRGAVVHAAAKLRHALSRIDEVTLDLVRCVHCLVFRAASKLRHALSRINEVAFGFARFVNGVIIDV